MTMSRLAVAVALALGLFAAPTFAQVCDPKKEVCPPPPCDPKTQVCDGGADCSPGFYKNHVSAWCAPGSDADLNGIECQDSHTYSCTELVCMLTAEPPCKSPADVRAFAKACLDSVSPADICSE